MQCLYYMVYKNYLYLNHIVHYNHILLLILILFSQVLIIVCFLLHSFLCTSPVITTNSLRFVSFVENVKCSISFHCFSQKHLFWNHQALLHLYWIFLRLWQSYYLGTCLSHCLESYITTLFLASTFFFLGFILNFVVVCLPAIS